MPGEIRCNINCNCNNGEYFSELPSREYILTLVLLIICAVSTKAYPLKLAEKLISARKLRNGVHDCNSVGLQVVHIEVRNRSVVIILIRLHDWHFVAK